jgi:hypothetical protein
MGIVGGETRHYTGGGLGHAPWKCPACGAEQTGAPEAGCTVCGAGTQKAYKAPETAADYKGMETPGGRLLGEFQWNAGEKVVHRVSDLESTTLVLLARQWAAEHPESPLYVAFMAGYLTAQREGRTVSPEAATLTLAGKVPRTIIAALQLFRDQVLKDAQEEIASGEWCSVQEVEDLIAHLQEKV